MSSRMSSKLTLGGRSGWYTILLDGIGVKDAEEVGKPGDNGVLETDASGGIDGNDDRNGDGNVGGTKDEEGDGECEGVTKVEGGRTTGMETVGVGETETGIDGIGGISLGSTLGFAAWILRHLNLAIPRLSFVKSFKVRLATFETSALCPEPN